MRLRPSFTFSQLLCFSRFAFTVFTFLSIYETNPPQISPRGAQLFQTYPSFAIYYSILFVNQFTDSYSTVSYSVLTQSSVWAGFYLTLSVYLLVVYSAVLYLVSFLADSQPSAHSKFSTRFVFTDANSVLKLLVLPVFMFLILTYTWAGPSLSTGYGNIIFTSFERKMILVVLSLFTVYLSVLLPSYFLNHTSSYDFLISITQLTFWLPFLFLSANVLTLSFVIEVLTALITLMLITSYSSSYHSGVTHQPQLATTLTPTLPTTFLSSLLIFFWTSLVTTLSLFVFLVLAYYSSLSLEWSVVNLVLTYSITAFSVSELTLTSYSWLFILITVYLKCAIVPFFLWKPTFFKGLTLPTLFYYVVVFYNTLFLYFMYFLMGLFSDLFTINLLLTLLVLVLSIAALPLIFFETFNLKAFFAISSISNSVLLLFTLTASNNEVFTPFY